MKKGSVIFHKDNSHIFQDVSAPQISKHNRIDGVDGSLISFEVLPIDLASGYLRVLLAFYSTNWVRQV